MNGISCCGQRGFTLIEVAFVLFIVGLLLTGLIAALRPQIEARERRATLAVIEDARVALHGFAMAHGRLPCPDADGDGAEDCAPPMEERGWLPWATLGVAAPGDAWGNRLLYRVDAKAAIADCDYIRATGGNISVHTRGDNPASSNIVEGKFRYLAGRDVPAVVLSHGRNGYGGSPVGGGAQRAGPAGWAGTDEGNNAAELPNESVEITSRLPTRGDGTACSDTDESLPFCEFDDLVSWLSPSVLYYHYVNAGKCPTPAP